MKEEIIIYEDAMFWTDGSGILNCKFNNKDSNAKLDYTRAKLYIRAITKLCNGKAMPFLIDVRDSHGSFTIAAAKLISKDFELVRLRISEAFVINNIGITLLIKTYKRIFNPITPFGVFREVEDAKKYSLETRNEFHGSN